MRKANYPRLNLPPCQVSFFPLEHILGKAYRTDDDSKKLRRMLCKTELPCTNKPEDYRLKVIRLSDEALVYDDLRKQWLPLTPEEWVRQHFIAHLIRDLGYPPSLMMNEVPLELGLVDKRIDSVLYSPKQRLQPLPRMTMLIEYKAPHIKLSNQVLEQLIRYNYMARAPYLIISNGMEHKAYRIDYDQMQYELIYEIPSYDEIKEL